MALLLLVLPARATTWVLAADGTGDATTLAEGVGLLGDGDTLEVMPGTYDVDEVQTDADDITIQGADPATSILNANGAKGYPLVLGGSGTTLSGVTFENAPSYGVMTIGAVKNCIFVDNMVALSYMAVVSDSVFVSNTYAMDIPLGGNDWEVTNNLFVDNGEVFSPYLLNYGPGFGWTWVFAHNTLVNNDGGLWFERETEGDIVVDVSDNVFVGPGLAWNAHAAGTYTGVIQNNLLSTDATTYNSDPTRVVETDTLTADPTFVAWSDDGDWTNDDLIPPDDEKDRGPT